MIDLLVSIGLRSVFMSHVYDFYKPNLDSQYPVVDGKLSINCYLRAIEKCYHGYLAKAERMQSMGKNGSSPKDASYVRSMDDIDYMVFHSPVCKLTQKSLGRLMFLDFLRETCKVSVTDKKYDDLKDFRYNSEVWLDKRHN